MRPGGETGSQAPAAAVHLVRELPFPREQVFRAWSEPELFRQWFGAPLGSTARAEMDIRPGGAYRIEIRHPGGIGWTTYVVGQYLEVVPSERLVYTFSWERPPPPALGMGESRVTVALRDLGDSTEVRVTHELERRRRAFHRLGWGYSLRRLERLLERRPG